MKIRLYVNRTGDDIEVGAEVTNDGEVAIPANTLTVTVRVVNPLASPDSREYELSRFVMPMIETLEAGKTAYQLAYDSVPRRADPFRG